MISPETPQKQRLITKTDSIQQIERINNDEEDRPPSFTMQFTDKEKLLKYAETMPEETLRMGIEIIHSLPLTDMDDLLYCFYQDGNKGVQNFFMRKAVRELEERTVDLPPQTSQILKHFSSQQFGANPIFATVGKVVDVFAMPSLYEVREIVKKSGKNTLREIEQATTEKLANKILR